MQKRILSAFLALFLCISALYIPQRVKAATVSDDDIINAVLVSFHYNEGTYDSVNRNDNGALSLGKLQWHGARALELLKEISAADPALARQLLGDSLYQEILGSADNAWGSRILSQQEAVLIAELLSAEASHRIQDKLAKKDISAYLSHGRSSGLQDAAVLVYYCDLENQYGYGGAGSLLSRIRGRLGKSIDTLDELHSTLLQVTGNYHSRRIWVYNYCSSLDWSKPIQITAPQIPANLDVTPPTISKAKAVCLNRDTFRIEVEATDNMRVADCRVEIRTDTDEKALWAGYCKCSGNTWSLDFTVDGSYSMAERYDITVTASDSSGNGTSKKLRLTRNELLLAQEESQDPCIREGHDYIFLYDTKATCLSPAFRTEQCQRCAETRRIQTGAAADHDFEISTVPASCGKAGSILQTCRICSARTQTSIPINTAHDWSGWELNETTGRMERRCENCGAKCPIRTEHTINKREALQNGT